MCWFSNSSVDHELRRAGHVYFDLTITEWKETFKRVSVCESVMDSDLKVYRNGTLAAHVSYENHYIKN
jgi:hypothetical protein